MSQVLQASYNSNQYQEVQLIRYVIEKELEIKRELYSLNELWDDFFYTEKFMSDYIPTNNGPIIIYRYRTTRRINTTDANVAQYRKASREFDLLITNAVKDIKIMVYNGADLQLCDQYGYTVVDYCYTEEIYDVLRDLGAPFSLQAWSYFNPGKAMIAGTVAVIACAVVCGYCSKYYSKKNY